MTGLKEGATVPSRVRLETSVDTEKVPLHPRNKELCRVVWWRRSKIFPVNIIRTLESSVPFESAVYGNNKSQFGVGLN